jgi:uncharacterized protein involved in outer membrane biogenesis
LRKIVLAVLAVFAVAIIGIVATLTLVDWQKVKTRILAEGKSALGRELAIDGDVSWTIWPAPSVTLSGVRLANAPGGVAPDMVRVKWLSVRPAILPLLLGRIEIGKIELLEPVIVLEALPNGRANWEFDTAAGKSDAPDAGAAADAGAPGAKAGDKSGGAAFKIGSLKIVDGTLGYADRAKGTQLKLDAINAEVSGAAPAGPFKVDGRARYGDLPFKVALSVKEMSPDRPTAAEVNFAVGEPGIEATLAGEITGRGESAAFKGQLVIESDNLAASLAALPGSFEAPALLANKLNVKANVAGNAQKAALSDMTVKFAGMSGAGGAQVNLGDRPSANAALRIESLNLDELLASAGKVTGARSETPSKTKPGAGEKPAAKAAAASRASTPSTFTAALTLEIGSAIYRKAALTNVKLAARIDQGLFLIERLQAGLPGGGDFLLSGRTDSDAGGPSFAGRIEAKTGQGRGLASWLGLDLAAIPENRMQNVALSATVDVNSNAARVSALDFQFDQSRLTGSASYGLEAPKPIAFDLSIDRLDADAYLGTGPKPAAGGGPAAKPGSSKDSSASGGAGVPKDLTAAGRLRAGDITYQGKNIRGLDVDMALAGGKLDLRRATVDSYAGINLTASGVVDLGNKMQFDLNLQGQASDLRRSLKDLDVGYRPSGSAISSARLAANAKGDDKNINVTDLKGDIGPVSFTGEVAMAMQGGRGDRPKITGLLFTSAIPVDQFLPGGSSQSSGGGGAASGGGAGGGSAGGGSQGGGDAGRWSREPMDLSGLKSVDLDLKFASQAVRFGNAALTEAKMSMALVEGKLAAKVDQGKFFGGPATAALDFDANGTPNLDFAIDVKDSDLGATLVALADENRVKGRFGLQGKVGAKGASEFDLVNSLQGKAEFAAQEGVLIGIDLNRISAQLKNLRSGIDYLGLVGGALFGGQTKIQKADGTWLVTNGVARTEDTKADLGSAIATLKGAIDLPKWFMDLTGQARLIEPADAPPIGVTLTGPVDQPVNDIKTEEFERYVATRAGGKLLPKSLPSKLDKLVPGLGGILGGPSPEPAPAPAASQAPAPSQTPAPAPAKEPATANDLLKGILQSIPGVK